MSREQTHHIIALSLPVGWYRASAHSQQINLLVAVDRSPAGTHRLSSKLRASCRLDKKPWLLPASDARYGSARGRDPGKDEEEQSQQHAGDHCDDLYPGLLRAEAHLRAREVRDGHGDGGAARQNERQRDQNQPVRPGDQTSITCLSRSGRPFSQAGITAASNGYMCSQIF
jgi:hypothetical protein